MCHCVCSPGAGVVFPLIKGATGVHRNSVRPQRGAQSCVDGDELKRAATLRRTPGLKCDNFTRHRLRFVIAWWIYCCVKGSACQAGGAGLSEAGVCSLVEKR